MLLLCSVGYIDMILVTFRDKLLLLALGGVRASSDPPWVPMLTQLGSEHKGVGSEVIMQYEHIPWQQASDLCEWHRRNQT